MLLISSNVALEAKVFRISFATSKPYDKMRLRLKFKREVCLGEQSHVAEASEQVVSQSSSPDSPPKGNRSPKNVNIKTVITPSEKSERSKSQSIKCTDLQRLYRLENY